MLPRHTYDPADCQMPRDVMSRLGDTWSVLVILLLGQGPRRFSDLKRAANGISQRMLSLTLRGLERDGLVSRTVLPTNPPGVDYGLTEMGRSLWTPIMAIGGWARANQVDIEAARARYDAVREQAPAIGRTPGFPAPAPPPRASPPA